MNAHNGRSKSLLKSIDHVTAILMKLLFVFITLILLSQFLLQFDGVRKLAVTTEKWEGEPFYLP